MFAIMQILRTADEPFAHLPEIPYAPGIASFLVL